MVSFAKHVGKQVGDKMITLELLNNNFNSIVLLIY